jgi:hypothetical protein
MAMNDPLTPPPERALIRSSDPAAPGQRATGFERATKAMRMALPLVQRLLPLLDGNVGSAVSNLMSPHLPPPPPPPPVNLAPIEDSLAELQAEHRDLHSQVLEQNASFQRVEEQLEAVSESTGRNTLAQQTQSASLKRVEDQLELLSEATDRNALGQRAMLEEMREIGRKANVLALVGLGLLVVSILLNVLLLLYFRHLLP